MFFEKKLAEEKDYLSLLPKEIQVYIAIFLKAEIFRLKKTSKFWFKLITQDEKKCINGKSLKDIYEGLSDTFRKLLSHVALGEWDDAKKIWEKYPHLLNCRGTVYHPNIIYNDKGFASFHIALYANPGRAKYVNCTPFEIALMNEEYEMAREMTKHMLGEDSKQFTKVFPSGIIVTRPDWDREEARKRLQTVFNAIREDNCINMKWIPSPTESTNKALLQLYEYVKPSLNQQQGLVFDADFYFEALDLFDEKFNQFENSDQKKFWMIRVEEYLAYLLPTAYLRTHSQGLLNETKKNGCVLTDGSPYFVFHQHTKLLPGYDFFVNAYGNLWNEVGRWNSSHELTKHKNALNLFRERKLKERLSFIELYPTTQQMCLMQ